jgi:N-acetylglutamate synthase-like GNAT family acetyltransferase
MVMTANLSIRPATAADFAAVEALLRRSDLPTVGVEPIIQDFLVAESGKELVGVVGMEYCCSYGLLRSTAVDPQWRSKGVARQLVERIIAQAESRGINALYLLTTTAESYFPSFGFTKTTRDTVPAEVRATDEFRGACPASATVMSRRLRASSSCCSADGFRPVDE